MCPKHWFPNRFDTDCHNGLNWTLSLVIRSRFVGGRGRLFVVSVVSLCFVSIFDGKEAALPHLRRHIRHILQYMCTTNFLLPSSHPSLDAYLETVRDLGSETPSFKSWGSIVELNPSGVTVPFSNIDSKMAWKMARARPWWKGPWAWKDVRMLVQRPWAHHS